MTQAGRYENGVSAGALSNGHVHTSPGITDDRLLAGALPAASDEPGPSEPTAAAQPPETTTSSPSGVASVIVVASVSAVRRFFGRFGISL